MKNVVVNDLEKNEYSVFSKDQFGKVHFFKDGEIVLTKGINRFDDLKKNEKGEFKSIGLDYIENLRLSNLRKKNKIDLNADYNFYGSHVREDWEYLAPKYDLYIYIGGDVKLDFIGELVRNVVDGETSYINYYNVTFKSIDMVCHNIEREQCETYTLKENERFSESYGTKENPCIRYYNLNERFINPINEKGIIRCWRETERKSNANFVITCDYITRSEQDNERKEREKIAEIMSKALGKNTISNYDVKRLLEVVNITIKE